MTTATPSDISGRKPAPGPLMQRTGCESWAIRTFSCHGCRWPEAQSGAQWFCNRAMREAGLVWLRSGLRLPVDLQPSRRPRRRSSSRPAMTNMKAIVAILALGIVGHAGAGNPNRHGRFPRGASGSTRHLPCARAQRFEGWSLWRLDAARTLHAMDRGSNGIWSITAGQLHGSNSHIGAGVGSGGLEELNLGAARSAQTVSAEPSRSAACTTWVHRVAVKSPGSDEGGRSSCASLICVGNTLADSRPRRHSKPGVGHAW